MPKSIKYEIKFPPVLNEKMHQLIDESGMPSVEKYLHSLVRAAWKERNDETEKDEA